MEKKVRNIRIRTYPKIVKILVGAPAMLVSLRSERGDHVTSGHAYETNREIKYWSTWFLLKSLTTTSYIQYWTQQKKYLFAWLQMNENTFRRHLAWLKSEGLVMVDKHNYSIRLCSYEAAAEKLGIDYKGVYGVGYAPEKCVGQQPFQYLLRTEEFEHHKQKQLEALMRRIDNNPSLKNDLIHLITQMGADYQRLVADPAYFAARMIRLQIKLFKEGSDSFQHIMQLRADINRGARLIKTHHNYRSAQSVAYMKRKMHKLGLARIWSVWVESEARMRFSIPAQEGTPPGRIHDGMQDGYKYVKGSKKTMWRLTDQVAREYSTNLITKNSKSRKCAA